MDCAYASLHLLYSDNMLFCVFCFKQCGCLSCSKKVKKVKKSSKKKRKKKKEVSSSSEDTESSDEESVEEDAQWVVKEVIKQQMVQIGS